MEPIEHPTKAQVTISTNLNRDPSTDFTSSNVFRVSFSKAFCFSSSPRKQFLSSDTTSLGVKRISISPTFLKVPRTIFLTVHRRLGPRIQGYPNGARGFRRNYVHGNIPTGEQPRGLYARALASLLSPKAAKRWEAAL